jgi:L-alanine-DL-glutamate epimerase-like enolase superfamily enzyme
MLEVELKTLHLSEPFRIAYGASATRQVVRVRDGAAVGEAPLVPYYQERAEDVMAWLGGTRSAPGAHTGGLALDLLERDLAGEPLWRTAERVLGPGRRAEEIFGCRSLGIPEDLGVFRGRVVAAAGQFRVLKLKLGSGDVDFDEAIVATARTAAPGVEMIADVNGGWSVAEAGEMLGRLRGFGLRLIEQPISSRLGDEGWVELKARAPAGGLPVFADESARNAADVRRLAGLVAGVNVKLLKCGSFAGAIEMIAAAREHGLGVILGCMIETSIGVTAAAHLAPWADFVDLDGHLYLEDDDYAGISFTPDGRLVMPAAGGIGVHRRT